MYRQNQLWPLDRAGGQDVPTRNRNGCSISLSRIDQSWRTSGLTFRSSIPLLSGLENTDKHSFSFLWGLQHRACPAASVLDNILPINRVICGALASWRRFSRATGFPSSFLFVTNISSHISILGCHNSSCMRPVSWSAGMEAPVSSGLPLLIHSQRLPTYPTNKKQ